MLTYFLLCFIIYLIVRHLYNSTQKPKNYPPGPKWYPIVGSFLEFQNVLKSKNDVAYAFNAFSEQYKSKIIALKLGAEHIIMVFSPKLIKHISFDDNYLGRPDIYFNRVRALGTLKGITLSSGKLWETQRTYVAKYLRKAGYGRTPMEIKITNEIKEVMEIIDSNPIDIDFRRILCPCILNVLWTFVDGNSTLKQDPRVAKLLDLMHRRTLKFDASGGTLNFFPWLRFLAPEKFGYTLLQEINSELVAFLEDTLEKHFRTWTEEANNDLIYAYISEMKRFDGTDTFFTYEQLRLVCLDIFYAGTNVTSGAIDFAFFAMAIHQDVQAKVQKILDETFDPSKPLEYQDKLKVPYIEAVICEIHRCYTNTPLGPPRSPIKTAVLDGYELPKGSTIYLCYDSIYKNSEYFEQPNIFKPERFLDSNEKLTFPEGFFPFGLGKRKCFGDALGKMSLFMIFTEILRKYTVHLVNADLIQNETFIPGIFRLKKTCPIKLVKRF